MAKEKAPVNESGFAIYDKQGKTGDRIALNLATGVAVETDGKGKYFVHLPSGRHNIVSDESLEALVGMPEPEGDLRGE